MRVLVVAPTSREYKYMRATLDAAQNTKHDYTLICSGIGKAGAAAGVATAVAKAAEPFDAIAVIGFAAGSLGFKQGDVVAPNRAIYHDCDVPEGFIPELTDPYALAKLIKKMRLDVDQVILYPSFAHISYKRDGRNRNQFLYNKKWKGPKDI